MDWKDWSNSKNFYEPPYNSPIEDIFAYNVEKYFRPEIDFQRQVEVHTICGRFVIDFVAHCGSQKVAFECDGKEYHEASRDEWRDAMILGAKAIDAIYHFQGKDLYYHIEDCLYIISKWNPELFSIRGLSNLQTLASDTVQERILSCEPPKEEARILLAYPLYSQREVTYSYLKIVRRVQNVPEGKRSFWQYIFTFAKQSGGGNLDELIEKYRNDFKVEIK